MTKTFRYLVLALFAVSALALSASAQDQEVAEAYNGALAELKNKDYPAAQEAFRNAQQIASEKGESDIARKAENYVNALYYNVGVVQMKAGDVEQAKATFEAGIEANSGGGSALLKNHKGLASLIDDDGDPAASMEAWLKVAEVATTEGQIGEANKAYAQAEAPVAKAMQAKQLGNVIEYGNMFLENTETANVHYYLAATYNQQAQYEQALQHATQAIELENRSGNAMAKIKLEEATALEGLGRLDEALAAYKGCQTGPYKPTCDYKAEQLTSGGQ